MKKQIIIALSLIACIALKAQKASEVAEVKKVHKSSETLESGSSFHFNVGGGLHDFSYTLTNGTKQSAQVGYTVNVAYSYFFSPHWGFQTGVGAQTIKGLSTLNYQSTAPAVDALGRTYDYRTNYQNWQEQQEAIFCDVPLVLQYRHAIGKNFGIIASAGGKVAIPVYNQYKSTGNGQITTTGYYSQWNTELSDLPQYGFATTNEVPKGKLSFNTTYMAVADLGALIRLTDKTDLYIGGYINYGLNNIIKSSTSEVYQQGGIYNGLFASNQIQKVTPITFGVKIGLYLKMGKKDSDKDGVADSKDLCPNTPKEAFGLVDKKGCPIDTDGDGVPDYLDKCPNTPKEAYGKVDASGCPIDTDKDGVPDYLDKCPDTPKEAIGFVDKDGCPLDSDGDGVPDYLDKCLNTPKEAIGTVDQNGCPKDTDGDGVPDYLDKCPKTPKAAKGMVDKNGCPLDSDGDGVYDYLDNCPKLPGVISNHGCPEVKKAVKALFQKALHGIQFATGKSDIKPISYLILDPIANALIANPTYIVEIQGHTDNVGRPDANMILSDKRAEAVKKYLIFRGVDEKRMTSHGFGDTLPVASNATPKGKTLNRRVEFVVTFEALTIQ
jgi:outer membrane protein OmpA-like peptidoglycan-associated protein